LPVTAYQYDRIGNLAGSTRSFDADFLHHDLRTIYRYDARNRLTDMGTTNASYDGSFWTTNCIAAFNYNPSDCPLPMRPETAGPPARRSSHQHHHHSRRKLLLRFPLPPGERRDDQLHPKRDNYDRVGNRHSRRVSTSALTNAGVIEFPLLCIISSPEARGSNPIFSDDEYRTRFLKALEGACQNPNWRIHA
jgi:hypothetical protein